MDEDTYRIKEYPNKEKGFLFDEEIFSKFSYDLFNFPVFAILYGIYLNIVYIISLKRNLNITAILLKLCIHFLIIKIILNKLFRINEIK